MTEAKIQAMATIAAALISSRVIDPEGLASGLNEHKLTRLRDLTDRIYEAVAASRDAIPLVDGDELAADQFPGASGGASGLTEVMDLPLNGIDLERVERSLVMQALVRSGWNQTRAAPLLGLNRDQIRYRIEKFKLEREPDS